MRFSASPATEPLPDTVEVSCKMTYLQDREAMITVKKDAQKEAGKATGNLQVEKITTPKLSIPHRGRTEFVFDVSDECKPQSFRDLIQDVETASW